MHLGNTSVPAQFVLRSIAYARMIPTAQFTESRLALWVLFSIANSDACFTALSIRQPIEFSVWCSGADYMLGILLSFSLRSSPGDCGPLHAIFVHCVSIHLPIPAHLPLRAPSRIPFAHFAEHFRSNIMDYCTAHLIPDPTAVSPWRSSS